MMLITALRVPAFIKEHICYDRKNPGWLFSGIPINSLSLGSGSPQLLSKQTEGRVRDESQENFAAFVLSDFKCSPCLTARGEMKSVGGGVMA